MIIGYVPLWIVGLAGVYWPAVLLVLLQRFVRARVGGVALAAIGVAGVLVLSVPVGIGEYGWTLPRGLSALGNATVWLAFAALLALRPSASVVARGLGILVVFQAFVIVVAWVMYPYEVPVPILHDSMGWAPSGFEMMADNSLYYQGWLGETAFRSGGIMGNPTWCGALGAIGVLIGIDRIIRTGLSPMPIVLLIAGALGVHFSLSRATLIALGLALIVAAITYVGRRHNGLAVLLWLAVVGALVVVGATMWHAVLAAVGEINDQRSGSLVSRTAIYQATWRGIVDHPLPLIGYGIKPQEDALVASIASHSTYLGLLYRAGAIGVLLFVGLLVKLQVRAVRRADGLGVALVVFVAAWCVLEDFDAGHVVPIALLIAAAGAARDGVTAYATQSNASPGGSHQGNAMEAAVN